MTRYAETSKVPAPCPFCGSPAVAHWTNQELGITFIQCSGCSATVSFTEAPRGREAVLAWNARSGVDEQVRARRAQRRRRGTH
ncbi:Lar family restriction alleviation protein [Sediminicurvatus halobius]|uniref:Restriction alleviation protein, Lar family n=1 Tax=Sediminicurvatus halobius TaxID=2182432 RepID=A0A2U2MXQ2_9GAMM|nr:Lar family restriction alleviation protein [Spiribacter halobius]PWG61726.1 hypothetical protein DEM34_14765 [Spiribacter halobius]UEX76847.1 Lar family restriction alleviation protein [Spiribacter halobius]